MADTTITAMSSLAAIDRTADYLAVDDTSAGTTGKATPNFILGFTGGNPVSTSDTQTLTNKTLGNTNTISLKDTLFTLQDNSDTTKQAQFELSGITTGTTRTVTLPDANLTVVGTATTQTLTNKTLTSPTINTPTIVNPTLQADTVSEYTSANGVTIDGLNIKDGVLNTNNSVVTANIAASAVTPTKLVSGTGTGWAWASWTVTWTNITVGNGTVTSKYIQIGKTVFYRVVFVLGTTSSIASGAAFSLPVTKANYGESGSGSSFIGDVEMEDTGASNYTGKVFAAGAATTGQIYASNAGSTYVGQQTITNLVPFTFASGDSINMQGFYEAQ